MLRGLILLLQQIFPLTPHCPFPFRGVLSAAVFLGCADTIPLQRVCVRPLDRGPLPQHEQDKYPDDKDYVVGYRASFTRFETDLLASFVIRRGLHRESVRQVS